MLMLGRPRGVTSWGGGGGGGGREVIYMGGEFVSFPVGDLGYDPEANCQGLRLAMMSALPRESYPDRYHLNGGVDKLLNRSGPTFQNIPDCVLPCVA